MIEIKVNNSVYTVEKGINLGKFLKSCGFDKMPCGGHGKCGKCKVYATGALSPVSQSERMHLTEDELLSGLRLACTTAAEGNCIIEFKTDDEREQIFTDGFMPSFILSPAFSSYGAAIDIGTTTVALRIYNTNGQIIAEKSRYNSQRAFGADVISRIEAAINGEGKELAEAVCSDICALISESAEKSGISTGDIDSLVITGNTVMLYLLTETSPEPLSHAPFNAGRLFGEALTAKELSLSVLSDNAKVYLPPCISAFVGADITTAILASDIYKSDKSHILADIGTNGEMALWHEGKLRVASTAAGPAFEGAGISMGMPGAAGAIDRVTLNGNDLAVHIIGSTAPLGICGSGLIDAAACLLKSGILDESGFLEEDPAVIVPPVTLTQQDIRALQLAKSAIHAGIATMLKTASASCDDLESMVISGGFGSYLDIHSAANIGLFPKELESKARVIGNGALTGAAMLLLNSSLTKVCTQLAKNAAVTDLASNPVFSEKYIENMCF